MSKLGREENGAASFIVVIFLAIILSVLTIGFVRLAINEQRDSTDDDLTKRAFYAAESGTEDAKRAIREYLDGTITPAQFGASDDCKPPTSGFYDPVLSTDPGLDVEYTCQLIDLTPERYFGKLDGANQTITIPLVPESGETITSLEIKWHMNNPIADGGDGQLISEIGLPDPSVTALRSVNAWNTSPYRHPAMLRANIFSHGTGNLSSADISNPTNQHVSFLYPNRSGTSPAGNVANVGGGIKNANCNGTAAAGALVCSETFDGFSGGRTYYLRLTSLYRGAQFELIMNTTSGQASFKDAQAVIDVTGRAADVYRRVRTTVNLNNFADLPGEAISSLDAICKNFSVTNDAADFSGNPTTGSSCVSP